MTESWKVFPSLLQQNVTADNTKNCAACVSDDYSSKLFYVFSNPRVKPSEGCIITYVTIANAQHYGVGLADLSYLNACTMKNGNRVVSRRSNDKVNWVDIQVDGPVYVYSANGDLLVVAGNSVQQCSINSTDYYLLIGAVQTKLPVSVIYTTGKSFIPRSLFLSQ